MRVTQPPRRTEREWREKSEGSDAISVYFTYSIHFKRNKVIPHNIYPGTPDESS